MSIPSKLLTTGGSGVSEPSGEVLFVTTENGARNQKTENLMYYLYPDEMENFSGYRSSYNANDTHLVTDWTVPDGVRTLQVCMVGTGSFGLYKAGGNGGSLVHGTLFVAPGQVLEVHIPKDIYYASYVTNSQFKKINPKIYRDGVLLLDCEGYGIYTDPAHIGDGGIGGPGSNYSGSTGGGGGGAGGYRGFRGGNGGSRETGGGIVYGEVPEEGGGGGGGGWRDLGGGVGLWGEGITVQDSWGGAEGSDGYGRNFGGGSAGLDYQVYESLYPLNSGDLPGVGAIRILWGEGREFPSTKVEEKDSWTVSLNGLTPRPQIKLYQDEGTYTYEITKDGFLSGVALGGGGGGGGASGYNKGTQGSNPVTVRTAGGGANANFDNLPVKAGDVVTVTVPPRAMGPTDSTDTSFSFSSSDVSNWTTDTPIGNAGGDSVISINGYECRGEGGAAPVGRWFQTLAPAVRAQPIHTNAPAGLVTNGGEGGLGGEGNIQATQSSTEFEVGGGGGAGGYDGRGGDGVDGSVATSTTLGGETGVGALSGAGGCCNTMTQSTRLTGTGGPGAELYGHSIPTNYNGANGLSSGGGSCPIFGWDISTKFGPLGRVKGDNWGELYYYYEETKPAAYGSRIGGGSGLAFKVSSYNVNDITADGLHGGIGAVGLYFSDTPMIAQPFQLSE